jgi:hypothetical protein
MTSIILRNRASRAAFGELAGGGFSDTDAVAAKGGGGSGAAEGGGGVAGSAGAVCT